MLPSKSNSIELLQECRPTGLQEPDRPIDVRDIVPQHMLRICTVYLIAHATQ